jgi:sugar lactone lactonase YvrE/enterochelin esterase-like enzyme
MLCPASLHADDARPPKGEVTRYTFDQSKIFPGTTRDYWVYVPKQYDPAKPACLHVNQDGVQFNAPAVFDELIHKKEMPIVIGVFIQPGRVKATSDKALDRANRSYEYDGLGDAYARFLLEELLPEVEKKTASDGRALKFSRDGNDRCIAGSSSGAICAFTAAWERPDAFRRVFSAVGTYVGLRGGNVYPTLIRKVEPKPLRVFLEDGSGDLNIYGGDWWMANQEMERALTFAGYEVNHAWGTGGHNGIHATEVFPDAMRWLWKDWPAPIKAGAGSPQLKEIVLPGEEWKLVSKGYTQAVSPTVNARGEVVFTDLGKRKTYRFGLDGNVTPLPDVKRGIAMAFGPDGRLYAGMDSVGDLFFHDAEAASKGLPADLPCKDLVVGHNGGVYVVAELPHEGAAPRNVLHHVSPNGAMKVVDSALSSASALALSPDQSLLYVADGRSHWVYSYQIKADGSLAFKQRYYHLHAPDDADDAGAGGLAVDRNGRLYVATRMGIQVCDQAGRVNCILPTPNGKATSVRFGGADFDTLFVTCGDRVYQRKMKVKGANAFEAPIKPTPPRL